MFTFVVLYMITYALILTFILIFIRLHNVNKNVSQLSFNMFWQNLNIYVSSTWTFKWLFFQLSGLPPVFFFFLKFNILFHIMKHSSFFLQLLVFLNLLLGMFFYTQIFGVTNRVYSSFFLKTFVKNNKILTKNSFVITDKYYTYFNAIHAFLFISFCSFLFFFDIFIIVRTFIT